MGLVTLAFTLANKENNMKHTQAELEAIVHTRIAAKAIQSMLVNSSISRGYSSVISECSYASSKGAFGVEAQVTVDWRDAVWNYAFEVQKNVDSGARDKPTLAEMLQELPDR